MVPEHQSPFSLQQGSLNSDSKMIDAGSNLSLIPDDYLEAAGIDVACGIRDASKGAYAHIAWPVHPVPEQDGMNEKVVLEMLVLLKEGTWPDGLKPAQI